MSITELKIFHRVTVRFTDGREPVFFDYATKDEADEFGQGLANQRARGEVQGIESIAYNRMGSGLIPLN